MQVKLASVVQLNPREGYPIDDSPEMEKWEMEFGSKLSEMVGEAWDKGVWIYVDYDPENNSMKERH